MSRWYLPMLSIVALACCASVSVPALAQTKGSDSIGDTVRMVRNGSLRERLEALERVSQLRDVRQIGEWKIVSLLQELASGDNPRIARRAVKAMGDLVLGADRTLKEEVRSPLLKLLNDAQLAPLVRAEAALQLGLILTAGDFADAQAVAALVASGKAGGGTPEVAAAAILALGEIGDPKGKEAIRAGLSATEQVVKEAAIEALGKFLAGKDADKIMDASLVPLLMRLLSDPGIGPDAKERILESVGRTGGAGAEAAIVHVLETEDKPSTVLAALRALRFVGGAKAATALVTTFEKFDIKEGPKVSVGTDVRTQVCATSGELFDLWNKQRSLGASKSAADLLSKLLIKAMINDTSDSVRKEAIVAVGNLYNKRYDRREAAAALIAMLGTLRTDDMKGIVAESLEMLSGRSFGTDADRWERWFSKYQTQLAAAN